MTTPTRRAGTPRAPAPAHDETETVGPVDARNGHDAGAPSPIPLGADPDGGHGHVHELLTAAVDEAARLLEADGAMVYLLDPVAGHLRFAHDAGIKSESGRERIRSIDLPVGVGMFGRAVAERGVVLTGDYLADASFPHAPDTDRVVIDVGIRSMVVAPLVAGDEVFGALGTFSAKADAFSASDIGLVRALADHAAASMSNARLIEQLDASRRELAERAEIERAEIARRADAEQALREIAARITVMREPTEILRDVVKQARRLVDADGVILDLLDPASGNLRWAYDDGLRDAFTQEERDQLWISVGVGATGVAVAEDRVIVAHDDLASLFPPSPESTEFYERTGFHSMIAAPITGDAGPLGVIEVYARERAAFTDTDAGLVFALASQAAIAITNARLIEELARSREDLARTADAERTLREIANQVSATHDQDEILQAVIDASVRLLGANGAIIDLLGDEGMAEAWTSHHFGERASEHVGMLGEVSLDADAGLSGRALRTRQVEWTDDYLADPRFDHTPARDAFVHELGIKSVISAPLQHRDVQVGALTVYTDRPNAFGEADAAMLAALAGQAAVAIANVRLIAELERSRGEVARRADSERTLREIGARVSAILEPDEVLQQIVEETTRLLESDGARIDLYDPELDALRWAYAAGDAMSPMPEWAQVGGLKSGQAVAGRAFAEQRPVRTDDYLEDDRFPPDDPVREFVAQSGIRSVVSVPLSGEGQPLGALSVVSRRAAAYDEADAEVLSAFATQASIAIRNARLIEELARSRTALARRADTERALREITARIAALREPDVILDRVVDEAKRLLGTDGAHLTRLSEDGTYLVPVVVSGLSDPETQSWLMDMEFPLGGGINGLAASEGTPIWTRDYITDPRIPHEREDDLVAGRLGLCGMAAAPLRAPGGDVIGTLAISSATPRDFEADELDLLQGLADQAAIAITNSTLLTRLTESEERYRFLVENAPDVVLSIGADSRLTFVSDAVERLTGRRPDELVGEHFGALVHESSREVAEIDWVSRMSPGSQEVRGRVNLRASDGSPIPAEFIAVARIDDDGRFLGANGSVRDMRERDRLERELRESEVRYKTLASSSPDLVFATDADGRYTFLSDRARTMLGWDIEASIGRHFSEYVAPGWEAEALASYTDIVADPTEVHTARIDFTGGDGRAIPLEINIVGSIEDGRLSAIHGVARDVSERERLERELQQSEARFRQLVQTSPDVIYRCDAEGNFVFMAEGAEALFGRTPAEIAGLTFADLTGEESLDEALANFELQKHEQDVVRRFQYMVKYRDGTTFPAEITSVSVWEDGKFVGVQGTVRDVTAQERLQRELRESQERYRFLVENSPDVVFSTDAEGRFTFMSESIERMSGWRPEQLFGEHFSKAIDPESLPVAGRSWTALMADPASEQVAHLNLRGPDGRLVPVEVSAIGMVDAEGRFAGIHGATRDIGERARLERELRESEERYRYLVASSPDLVWLTDEHGTFTFISDAARTMLGIEPSDLIGKPYSEIFSPSALRDATTRFRWLARHPTAVHRMRLPFRHADGHDVLVEINGTGMTADGRFIGAHGAARDVSERDRLERDLRRQAGELAAGEERAHLARELHDSVTQALFSMTLVSRSVELLLDRDHDAARQQLSQLRDLQREALAEMRALIFELRPGNLEQDGLTRALRTHTAALQGRIGLPVVVESTLDERLPLAVEEVLYRVAQEALHNVVKHAGARQVRVEVGRIATGVRLRIEDDGKGFDPARVPDGHLGLAGMRVRADRIGARFSVSSVPGQGTTIEVLVPLDALEAGGATPGALDPVSIRDG